MDEKILEEVIAKCGEHFRTKAEEIHIIKKFGNGRSGNGVYLIKVNAPANAEKLGKYILKVSACGYDEFFDEIINTVSLTISKDELTELHFPKYEYAGRTENALFYVYGVAGNGLSDNLNIFLPDGSTFK